MNQRISNMQIRPKDLTPSVYEGASIIEKIVLASSNELRNYFELKPKDCMLGPIPKFVTRKNPSLDNYFAELLLRSCYEPVNSLPPYEEHVIRGSQEELPTDQNPRLANAILIGIGGQSENPDFIRVYDEHSSGGTRHSMSVSQIVFERHVLPFGNQRVITNLMPIMNEINIIDSKGGAPYDHIFNLAKSLNMAQVSFPGFVSECLLPQWKRAIIGAILMSVCVSIGSFENYDNSKALDELKKEWDTYQQKSIVVAKAGFLKEANSIAVSWVGNKILNPSVSSVSGRDSFFSVRKMLFALRRVWHPQIVSFLMGFLFESMIQMQHSFNNLKEKEVPIRKVCKSYSFLYYMKETMDKLPNRVLLSRMNDGREKAIIVIYDPVRQNTAIFRTRELPINVWKTFYKTLIAQETDKVWYTPLSANGKIAEFILNGTDSFAGAPITKFGEEALIKLFEESIMSGRVNNHSEARG